MKASDLDGLKAIANPKRLAILGWLKDPRAHFPEQRDGDLVKDGVCGVFIADKLGVSQPTAHVHLATLTRAGLLTAKKTRQWIFYKRNETRIAALKKAIGGEL
ncbi:ArsR/SmtB family transcription factor [Ferrovibrio xuzhouensis]|uniref:ArsR/SmtB family transcription factor n=1 Tax=Ferrovibrio xuzhouensis TaxID=1576914 RepID=A0ABV7VIY1_9PROT